MDSLSLSDLLWRGWGGDALRAGEPLSVSLNDLRITKATTLAGSTPARPDGVLPRRRGPAGSSNVGHSVSPPHKRITPLPPPEMVISADQYPPDLYDSETSFQRLLPKQQALREISPDLLWTGPTAPRAGPRPRLPYQLIAKETMGKGGRGGVSDDEMTQWDYG